MTRLKNAWRALLGITELEPTRTVELLDLQPGDKLIICYSATLSQETCARLKEAFSAALQGDNRVLVMGSEIPKFVIARGLNWPAVEKPS